MLQKVIKVGNSLAITIPKSVASSFNWKAGQKVFVDEDIDTKTVTVYKEKTYRKKNALTPEFKRWLDGFNKKYKDVLAELAKR